MFVFAKGFIDENKPFRVNFILPLLPLQASTGDVWAILLSGMQAFLRLLSRCLLVCPSPMAPRIMLAGAAFCPSASSVRRQPR